MLSLHAILVPMTSQRNLARTFALRDSRAKRDIRVWLSLLLGCKRTKVAIHMDEFAMGTVENRILPTWGHAAFMVSLV
jgi:hypothetical protein